MLSNRPVGGGPLRRLFLFVLAAALLLSVAGALGEEGDNRPAETIVIPPDPALPPEPESEAAPAAATSPIPPRPLDPSRAVAARRDRLYDVRFVTESRVWVVGYPGLLLRSEDAGETWERVDPGTREALFSVDFVDPEHGWVSGRTGLILHTADGGNTWARRETGVTESIFAVDFLDERTGCAVSNWGQTLFTTDGGATWTVREVEPMINASLNAVVMLDARTVLVAGDYPSWEMEMEGVDATAISNVYRTEDGGATWQVVPTGSTAVLFDMAFRPDGITGYAVGTQGAFLATRDGGRTWRSVATGRPNHLMGLALQEGKVWAVGLDGVVIEVTGRGVRTVPTGTYVWLSSIALNPAGRGVIVGGRGTLLRGLDGGQAWR